MESVSSLKLLKDSAVDEHEAVAMLRDLQTAEIEDADYHIEVARWADELEEPQIALREWNLALRDRPNDIVVAGHLVEAHLDAGRLDKAARYLRLITREAPSNADAWQTLIEVQRQLGQLEESDDSRARAAALTGDKRFLPRPAPPDQILGRDESEGDIDEAFLVLFQERFQGREGVYARQWVDPAGQTGYSPIREPLSLKAVKNHLLGNHTLGIYPLRMDNTVCFAAFDLDLANSVIKSCAPGSPGWKEASVGLEAYADRLEGRASQMGLPLHRADSGYKGLHLWALFAAPVPAKQARQMCKAIAATITMPPVVRCEIFPKQSSVPQDGLGNLIKVPLGVHRKTGRRVWFTTPEPQWPAQRAYLQTATRISREQLSQYQDTLIDQELSAFAVTETAPTAEAGEMEVHRPEVPEYHPDTDSEYQLILSRCVTLRALVAKVEHTGQLGHDEIRVITHTVGHIATGPQAVNSLLGRCLQTEAALYLKKPLRGNPMSCASIRAKIPEITAQVPCDCRFSQRGGLYPTPTLHLSQATSGLPLDQLQFQALLADFLRAKKEVFRWSQLLENYSAKVNLWFEETGADEMRTSFGLLRRRIDQQSGAVSFELVV